MAEDEDGVGLSAVKNLADLAATQSCFLEMEAAPTKRFCISWFCCCQTLNMLNDLWHKHARIQQVLVSFAAARLLVYFFLGASFNLEPTAPGPISDRLRPPVQGVWESGWYKAFVEKRNGTAMVQSAQQYCTTPDAGCARGWCNGGKDPPLIALRERWDKRARWRHGDGTVTAVTGHCEEMGRFIAGSSYVAIFVDYVDWQR